MSVANMEVRAVSKQLGVPLWRVADALGVSEPTMTRKLRRELSEKDSKELCELIKKIAQE